VGYTACKTYCLKDAKSVDELTLIKVRTAWCQLSSIEMSLLLSFECPPLCQDVCQRPALNMTSVLNSNGFSTIEICPNPLSANLHILSRVPRLWGEWQSAEKTLESKFQQKALSRITFIRTAKRQLTLSYWRTSYQNDIFQN